MNVTHVTAHVMTDDGFNLEVIADKEGTKLSEVGGECLVDYELLSEAAASVAGAYRDLSAS